MADSEGNVHIPAAVRARIAEGQRLFKAQAEGSLPQQPTPQPVASPAPVAPPGTPTAQQEPQPTHPSPPMVPLNPEGSPPIAAQGETHHEEHPEDALASLQRQLQVAEQRNRTLQGRMRQEVGARDGQINELRSSVQTLTTQMAELTARLLSGGQPVSSAENIPLTTRGRVGNITEAERNDYGEPFFDMIGRVAQEIADRRIAEQMASVSAKYDALGERVNQTQSGLKLSKDERRNRWLDVNLNGWRDIDNDPGFMDWLNQEDVNSGFPRMAILRKAIDDDNYDRIKSIFNGYVQELGVIAPPPPPRTAGNGRARLEAQAMPNGGGGRVDAIVPDAHEAPPTPDEISAYFHRKIHHPRSLTEAEITRFEGRMRTGLANGTIRGQQRI